MAFDKKYKDYGVVKVEGNEVRIYESRQNYMKLNTIGGTPLSAIWAGDYINVVMSSGEIRRYSLQQTYISIC